MDNNGDGEEDVANYHVANLQQNASTLMLVSEK
jgi:hypothetical protein